jgi:hypothetical protein
MKINYVWEGIKVGSWDGITCLKIIAGEKSKNEIDYHYMNHISVFKR